VVAVKNRLKILYLCTVYDRNSKTTSQAIA
jgi:hypothetical protein